MKTRISYRAGRLFSALLLLVAVYLCQMPAGMAESLSLPSPPPLQPVDLDSDRGDLTNGASTVPKGSLQVESGVTWLRNPDGSHAVDLPQGFVRLGILPKTELRLGLPDAFLIHVPHHDISNFGDVSVGIRQTLGELPGHVQFAVTPFLSLPTGAKELGSRAVDPGLELTAGRDIGKHWSVAAMSGFYWPSIRHHHNYI